LKEVTVNLANTYYQAMANKDIGGVASLLHPDVRLIGPLGEVAGKESVLQAVTRFAALLRSLRVHASFGSKDQAMVNYDVDFGQLFGICHTAALITFEDNLIARIELFFDARPFEKIAAKEATDLSAGALENREVCESRRLRAATRRLWGSFPRNADFTLENILTYALSPKAPSKADQYRHVGQCLPISSSPSSDPSLKGAGRRVLRRFRINRAYVTRVPCEPAFALPAIP
jgi:hypothetical protein